MSAYIVGIPWCPFPARFSHPKGLGLAVFFPGIKFAPNRKISIPEDFSVVTPDGTGYVISFHHTGSDRTWAEISPEAAEQRELIYERQVGLAHVT